LFSHIACEPDFHEYTFQRVGKNLEAVMSVKEVIPVPHGEGKIREI